MLEFKTIEDVYNAFDQVGCCSFATLDGKGGVESRIAHFFAWDEEGLYLRTMTVKPSAQGRRRGDRVRRAHRRAVPVG